MRTGENPSLLHLRDNASAGVVQKQDRNKMTKRGGICMPPLFAFLALHYPMKVVQRS
jgi:hypothetical protein